MFERCLSTDSAFEARGSDAFAQIRLEVCANLGVGGGTTPSLGLVRSISRRLPSVETMVRTS